MPEFPNHGCCVPGPGRLLGMRRGSSSSLLLLPPASSSSSRKLLLPAFFSWGGSSWALTFSDKPSPFMKTLQNKSLQSIISSRFRVATSAPAALMVCPPHLWLCDPEGLKTGRTADSCGGRFFTPTCQTCPDGRRPRDPSCSRSGRSPAACCSSSDTQKADAVTPPLPSAGIWRQHFWTTIVQSFCDVRDAWTHVQYNTSPHVCRPWTEQENNISVYLCPYNKDWRNRQRGCTDSLHNYT